MPSSRIKPMFVVSWFSTSLVDALLANVVAVSIMQATDSRITDLIFEIPKHCLLWPIAEPAMNALVNGQTDVDSVVSDLQEARSDHSEHAALAGVKQDRIMKKNISAPLGRSDEYQRADFKCEGNAL